jgi:hypothetical protein
VTESLVDAASQWVIDCYPWNSYHLLKSLQWLDRVAPDSREAVRLATLTHDMERAFPGPDSPVMRGLGDAEYNAAHSARSARIVGSWMRDNGADQVLISDVEALIRAHEDGGWPDADAVQAADSLSFLETNIDLFLGFVSSGKHTAGDVRRKFQYMYDRIRMPDARALARPLLETALARLTRLEQEAADVAGEGPRQTRQER